MKAMFRLREEHLTAFSKAARDSFEDRMLGHLKVAYRTRYDELGEKTARTWVRDGIDRAATYDIRIESDVARFLRLKFQLGENFDRAQAAAMLKRRDLPATLRLNGVLKMATSAGAVPPGRVQPQAGKESQA